MTSTGRLVKAFMIWFLWLSDFAFWWEFLPFLTSLLESLGLDPSLLLCHVQGPQYETSLSVLVVAAVWVLNNAPHPWGLALQHKW